VVVPLGAWTATAALDVLEAGGKREYGPGADAALVVGLVGAAGAALSGLTQYYPIQQESVRKVGATHAMLNVSATTAMLASYALRKGGNRPAARALSWLGLGLSLAGAYLGGSLSYQEHMGSDHAERTGLPESFTPVLALEDVPEDGRPTHARAGDIDLVILKQGQKLHALGGVCSHYGGPLWEGEVKDGCLTCPWHGSQFRLEDGTVCHGPATYPQPLFEARVRDGQVEVRAVPGAHQNVQ